MRVLTSALKGQNQYVENLKVEKNDQKNQVRLGIVNYLTSDLILDFLLNCPSNCAWNIIFIYWILRFNKLKTILVKTLF